MTFQLEKDTILAFHDALEKSASQCSLSVFDEFCVENWLWRAVHPFHTQHGARAVNDVFWKNFCAAFSSLQRRMNLFMAGENSLSPDGAVWVCSMGHFVGLFDKPWLGIAPTQKLTMLRYAEFHRVKDGKIQETALFLDIPALMMQVGLHPFPTQAAAQLVHPGPLSHDAVMLAPQPRDEGTRTLAAINKMISDLGQWQSGLPLEDELAQSWHEDMLWWGPAGIGATYTIKRYAMQHARPFRSAFSHRSKSSHVTRFAEGFFGGFFGWPSFTARPIGGLLGLPASNISGEFRVADLYRRRGDKLIENWVFIDLPHFFSTQGLNILPTDQP